MDLESAVHPIAKLSTPACPKQRDDDPYPGLHLHFCSDIIIELRLRISLAFTCVVYIRMNILLFVMLVCFCLFPRKALRMFLPEIACLLLLIYWLLFFLNNKLLLLILIQLLFKVGVQLVIVEFSFE